MKILKVYSAGRLSEGDNLCFSGHWAKFMMLGHLKSRALSILKGAQRLLGNCDVSLVIASDHYPTEFQEITKYLQERGYKYCSMTKGTLSTLDETERAPAETMAKEHSSTKARRVGC